MTVDAGQKKVYGDADPTLTATVEGAKQGDTIAYTLSREAGEAVGTYAITATAGENPNYTVTVEGGTFEITAAAVTVTADNKSKTYGDEDPELTATVEGAKEGATIAYTLSRAEGENAGEYAITVTVTDDAGYDVTVVGGTFTVEPRTVTVTAEDKSKVAGNADPELTATVEGLLGDDTVVYELSREAGETAGEYAITPTGEAAQGNYTVSYVAGTLTIGGAVAKVTYVDGGETVVRGNYATLAEAVGEIVEGDTITLLADVTDEGEIALGAGVTFDGDGHKVSGGTQIAVDAAGGSTVKNVVFDGIGTRTAPVPAITTADGLAGELAVTNCTFTNDGYVKTDIVVKPVAGAKVTIVDNVFSGLSGTAVIVDPASEDAVDYEATVTGNAFMKTGSATRAFAVVGAVDAEKLALDGNYVAADLNFGASVGGTNVSEIAYKMLAEADAVEATVELPTFIIKRTASDGYPTLLGYTTLKAAVADAKSDETILVTANAELTEAVTVQKNVTVDGQGHVVTASGEWLLKGAPGKVTLTDVTLAFADGEYSEIRLGGGIVLGDGATIDVTAVSAESLVYATGLTVADGATPTLAVSADGAKLRQSLVTGITLGEDSDIAVEGLAEGLYAAVVGDVLRVYRQEAKIGDVYYNSLQDAIDAANDGDVVEVIADITLPTGGLNIVDKNITITGATDEDGNPLYTITGQRTLTGEKDGAEIYIGSETYDTVDVTISNLNFRNFGDRVDPDGSAVIVFEGWTEGSKLTLDNVDIADYNQYAVSGIGVGEVEILNSVINGGGDADGVYAGSEIDMTISNTIIEDVGTGITADTGASVVVVGGEISGENGVSVAEGAGVTLGGGVKVDATDDAAKVADGGSLEIKSGVYTGDIDGLPGDVSISGGKYDRELGEGLVAEGAMSVDAEDGWYEVRRTLKIYDFVLEEPMKFTAVKMDASGNLLLSVNDGIKLTIDAVGLPFSADEPVDGFYVLSRVSMTETTYRHVPATLVAYDGENATLMIKARNLPAGGRLIAYGLSLDAE
ncbi:MAG: hypothetical protein IJJ84_07495 [Kiritimatiellae bacterium]|nr:hypothetical protein [Kiritimatiellia bacterium]